MNIEINTDHLSRDIATMKEQVANLREAQTQVYRCLEQLNTMWEGQAQQVFNMQTMLDRMTLRMLLQSLDNLTECMEYAKGEYEHCRSDVNDKIASIRLSGDT